MSPISSGKYKSYRRPERLTPEVPRPRLLESWDRSTGEFARAGFSFDDGMPGWRVILWECLPRDLILCMSQIESQGLRRWIGEDAILLNGNPEDFRALASVLSEHGFQEEGVLLLEVVEAPMRARTLRIPSGEMKFEATHIVGILNVTPDSFYDGGRHDLPADALARAMQLVADGATIIEVGGEKAGPGLPVTEREELDRVVPVIAAVRQELDVMISIDTRKPAVAHRAIEMGVDFVNDINGMRDPKMREVVAGSDVAVIIMHIQGEPRVHNPNPVYGSVAGDVTQFFHRQIRLCESDGIAGERIVIDPGPGFGKTAAHDMALMRHWGEFRGFPHPLMLGVSRKRFIGDVLNQPPEDRLEGSLGVTAYAMSKGLEFVRTHDVAATNRVVRMCDGLRFEWGDTA